MKHLFCLFALLTFSLLSAQTEEVNQTLNAWHKAAAEAKFDTYFSFMTDDGIFIGTDATENWNLKQFKDFSKPYFDKGKAWNFTAIQRHVFFNAAKDMAWFDELLETQMKLCRGSGVMRKEKGQWKIVHYVLSMTVPNDNIESVIKLKSAFDDNYAKSLKAK